MGTVRRSPPHPCCNVLLFFADRICIDRCGGELRVAKPSLQHMERDALNSRMDTEPMTEAFRGTVGRIWNARLDHDPLHDLPDAHAAKIPDGQRGFFARALRFPDAMRGIQGVEELCRHRDGSKDDFVFA